MNINYKEWYLLEIYSRLVNGIGADKAANAVIEIREHLDETESEYLVRGLEPEIARNAAMDRIGSPRQIARSFVRTGTEVANLWWTLCVCCCLTIVSLPIANPQLAIAVASFLILPAVASFFTARPLGLFILVTGAAVATMLNGLHASTTVVLPGAGTKSYGEAHRKYKSLKVRHDEYLVTEATVARQWREFFKKTTLVEGRQYSIPSLSYSYKSGSNEFVYSSPESFLSSQRRIEVGALPIIKSQFVSGRNAKHEVRNMLANLEFYQSFRKTQLQEIESVLNTSRLERASAGLLSEITNTACMAIYAWLTSCLFSSMFINYRTRRKQLLA